MLGFWGGSRISWTICNQSARRSRQITTLVVRKSAQEQAVVVMVVKAYIAAAWVRNR